MKKVQANRKNNENDSRQLLITRYPVSSSIFNKTKPFYLQNKEKSKLNQN